MIPMRALLSFLWLTAATLHAVQPGADLDTVVKPFFTQHCTSCHGAKKQKGDLRVDTLKIDFESPKIMGHWEEIMNRINSGDMPPDEEKAPPSRTEVARVAEWIAGQLHEAEVAHQASGRERVSFRKLSREEYANTIRDLLGVTFEAKGPGGLAGRSGLERLRAHRLRAHALAGARGKVSRRGRGGAR